MRVRRGEVRDVYEEHGRCAVFVHDQVIVLSEVATAIISAVPPRGAVSMDEVAAVLTERFGTPDPPLEVGEVARQHVLDLVAHDVLAWEQDGLTATPPPTPQGVAALREALRHLGSDAETQWQLPDGVTSPELVAAARRHRVVPVVAAALGRLDLPPSAISALSADSTRERASAVAAAIELAGVVRSLEDGGIRVLSVKGLALAVQAHGDVGARGTGDHDLLVAPADLENACGVLRAHGWMAFASSPSPGSSWAWRQFKGAGHELGMFSTTGVIDLHWHIGPARAGQPTFDQLWERRTTVLLGGSKIATLGRFDALAHSASHSAKDHWRWLRGLLDVHRLMADPATWQSADRPLRHDQLLTVGLAARVLGTPPGSPPVVHQAVRLAEEAWSDLVSAQDGDAHVTIATRVPGVAIARAYRALARAGGGPGDFWRMATQVVLPPALLAANADRSAAATVPRVLAQRVAEVGSLWADALRRAGSRIRTRR